MAIRSTLQGNKNKEKSSFSQENKMYKYFYSEASRIANSDN